MSNNITKPLFLDETGKAIIKSLDKINETLNGRNSVSRPWSITIDTASSNPRLADMGGDKASWYQYRAKLGRYLVDDAGNARKLNRQSSYFFEDGTPVDESKGNVLVRLPRLYYEVTDADTITTITMCEQPFGNAEIMNEQWVGAYLGRIVDGRLVSRSSLNPTRSTTIDTFFQKAQANGKDFGLADYNAHRMMMLVFLCEYLSLDSQGTLGNGMTGVGNNWNEVTYNALTGDTAVLGDECGKVNFTKSGQLVDGACHVSLFGIEDPYGWFWEMVQGVYFGSSNNEGQAGSECFVYEGNRMLTTEELTSKPSGNYRQLTRLTSSGWIKKMILGQFFDILPSVTGGSSTSFWCDYFYANTTGQLLLWGGYSSDGSYCGLGSSVSHDAWTSAFSTVGSRLAYYGTVNIV